MRKLLFLICVLSFTPAAFAQSSMTIYGTLDEGITYLSGGNTSSVRLDSGISQSNKLGFLGREELGDGYVAVFRLESSFDISTGQLSSSNSLFNKRAYVGLSNDMWGTVTFGRQIDAMQLLVPIYGSVYEGQYSFHLWDYDRVANRYSVDNAVKYTSPVWRDFQFVAMYALANGGGNSDGSVRSFGASYSGKAINAAISYSELHDGTANGVQFDASMFYGLPNGSVVWGGKSVTVYGAGMSWQMGGFAPHGMYTNAAMTDQANHTVSLHTVEAGLRYRFSPELYSDVTFHRTLAAGLAFNNIAGVLDYQLSKRTDVYLVGGLEHATGDNGRAVAVLAGAPSFQSSEQRFVRVALHVLF